MRYTERLEVYLRAHADATEAVPMAAYMKHHFAFLGLKSPGRMELTRQFWKENGLPGPEELAAVVRELWALPEREYHYTALELLRRMSGTFRPDDIALLEELIVTKSWWDTVDVIAGHLVGGLLERYPAMIPDYTDRWISSDDIWLQRTALLFQLRYKHKTDSALLFQLAARCADSKQFFIRKAIGWALREYSKTNPDAVVRFVQETPLSPLSAREALKVVGKSANLAEKDLASDPQSRTMKASI
jgi:3-methyladenine DNA glycosylase AlkD